MVLSEIICEYNGVFYPQQNNNSAVVKALLQDRIWEKKLNNILNNYIKDDWVVVDVGAYIGSHTLTMSGLAKQVYSFEPQPLIYQCLSNTLKKKEIDNVVLFNLAASNKKGESRIYTNNDGMSSLQGIRDAKFNMNLPCDLNKLDNIIDQKIHLIKIDVEGHEWEVIDGATKLIKTHKPIIILETFRNKKNKANLLKFCEEFNYNMSPINCENFLLLPF